MNAPDADEHDADRGEQDAAPPEQHRERRLEHDATARTLPSSGIGGSRRSQEPEDLDGREDGSIATPAR